MEKAHKDRIIKALKCYQNSMFGQDEKEYFAVYDTLKKVESISED